MTHDPLWRIPNYISAETRISKYYEWLKESNRRYYTTLSTPSPFWTNEELDDWKQVRKELVNKIEAIK